MNAPLLQTDSDLAERLFWRNAVALFLRQIDAQAESSRITLEAIRTFSLPADDPDFFLLPRIARFLEAFGVAHADLRAIERQHLQAETSEKAAN